MQLRAQIYNTEITDKWTKEIVDSGADISPKMLEWIWAELKHKAETLKENGGMVTAFNPGVVWSDIAISKGLQEDLKTAVLPLEQVPEDEKDYHPGSDQRVVDLVHPSLFPVVYGRTRILRDEILTRDGYLSWSGRTETLPKPSDSELMPSSTHWDHRNIKLFSTKFQWLPCDVEFEEEGGCRIVSYINNLHPQKHKDLYQVIEKVIAKAIPLWDESLHEAVSEPKARIPYEVVEYYPSSEPQPDWEEDHEAHEAWYGKQVVIQPEPQGDFQPLKQKHYKWGEQLSLRNLFREKGLQVIVKLANIELTPDKPRYEGGTWHVEGQLVSLTLLVMFMQRVSHYSRMNVSAPQRFITTLQKTLPRAFFHSEHERIIIRLTTLATSKVDMISCSKFMGLALKQMAGATALSPKNLEMSYATRAVSSRSPMCCNIELPPLSLPTKPSRDIVRSSLCFSLIHTFVSSLLRMCRLRGRIG